MTKLKAPFPYFGGKSKVADVVWERFGEVKTYVEPFAGSLAVLLARPLPHSNEIVNDLNGRLVNFWRALKHDPEGVASHAEHPPFKLDFHARRDWLLNNEEKFRETLRSDPEWYDTKAAGWWVWCMAMSIGTSCDEYKYSKPSQLPRGVLAHSRRDNLPEIFQQLSDRLKWTQVLSGDWERSVTVPMISLLTPTAIFLDPPYDSRLGISTEMYGKDTIFETRKVHEWCLANGDNPNLRIALCGYEGEYDLPDTWECLAWETQGGFKNNSKEDNKNKSRERIWFSPHCLKPDSLNSFLNLFI